MPYITSNEGERAHTHLIQRDLVLCAVARIAGCDLLCKLCTSACTEALEKHSVICAHRVSMPHTYKYMYIVHVALGNQNTFTLDLMSVRL